MTPDLDDLDPGRYGDDPRLPVHCYWLPRSFIGSFMVRGRSVVGWCPPVPGARMLDCGVWSGWLPCDDGDI